MVLLAVLEATVHTLQYASVFHVCFLWVQSGVGLTLKESWIHRFISSIPVHAFVRSIQSLIC